MKIDIFSDVHIDSWNTRFYDTSIRDMFEKSEGVDVCVMAGDGGNGAFWFYSVVSALRELYEYVVFVAGNHDYYAHNSGTLALESAGKMFFSVKRKIFVAATLWTNFRNNPVSALTAQQSIADFTVIPGMTTQYMR